MSALESTVFKGWNLECDLQNLASDAGHICIAMDSITECKLC